MAGAPVYFVRAGAVDQYGAPAEGPSTCYAGATRRGTVIGVGKVEEADFPGGRAYRVNIFLSPFNVHANRAPRISRVVALCYFKGRFVAATPDDCDKVKEQLRPDVERPGVAAARQPGGRRRGAADRLLGATQRGAGRR
jgi:phosphatidylserine decarboxylase